MSLTVPRSDTLLRVSPPLLTASPALVTLGTVVVAGAIGTYSALTLKGLSLVTLAAGSVTGLTGGVTALSEGATAFKSPSKTEAEVALGSPEGPRGKSSLWIHVRAR